MHVATPALKSVMSPYFLKGIKARSLLFGIPFPNFSIANERKMLEFR